MRQKASQNPKDFFIELPERDTNRLLKRPVPLQPRPPSPRTAGPNVQDRSGEEVEDMGVGAPKRGLFFRKLPRMLGTREEMWGAARE